MFDEPMIDDATLDRLIDGELSADERRRLLLALERQPDGWRRCALAYVESQSLSSAFKSLAAPWSAAQTPAATASLAAIVEIPRTHATPAPRQSRHSALLLATAASVALAFAAGWQLRGGSPTSPGSPTLAAVPAPPAENARQHHGDAVTLLVRDDAGRPQRVRVPLVEGTQLSQAFADAPAWSIPPQLRQVLDQRGLDLATRRRYAPMFFEQQDQLVPMVVPVDDAVITPVSRQVF